MHTPLAHMVIARIAGTLGVPVSTFMTDEHDAGRSPGLVDDPQAQAREIERLFVEITDPHRRKLCLDLVKALARD